MNHYMNITLQGLRPILTSDLEIIKRIADLVQAEKITPINMRKRSG